ncbi:carbonic anhydrase 4-like [Aulostomus maculatus]
MKLFVAVFAACVLVPKVFCASDTIEWCYDKPNCDDSKWPEIAPLYCNGTRQSPINIVSSAAEPNSNLTAFSFQKYNDNSTLTKITNTGKTVKVLLASGVKVSGGDLSETYDSIQFHLHWGNGTSNPGSEHTVNGKRYPMELHIVNMKESYNGNVTKAFEDSEGLAALGFLIEEMDGDETGQPESWKELTSYLANIKEAGNMADMNSQISLDDLLAGVDRTKYYRYYGSLTTPTCNEVVVWTVFKDKVKVSRDLIDHFSTMLLVGDSSSALMVDVYRNIQKAQSVTTQASSSSKICYSLGLMALSSMLWRN